MKEQRIIELLFEVKQGDKSPNQAWKEIMNLFNNGVLDDVNDWQDEVGNDCGCPPETCKMLKGSCKNLAYR